MEPVQETGQLQNNSNLSEKKERSKMRICDNKSYCPTVVEMLSIVYMHFWLIGMISTNLIWSNYIVKEIFYFLTFLTTAIATLLPSSVLGTLANTACNTWKKDYIFWANFKCYVLWRQPQFGGPLILSTNKKTPTRTTKTTHSLSSILTQKAIRFHLQFYIQICSTAFISL